MVASLARLIVIAVCISIAQTVYAKNFSIVVPMHEGGKSTYYIRAQLDGLGDVDFMVDTGSSYLTINEETLAALDSAGMVKYRRDLQAILANGSAMVVPVYTVSSLDIGGGCRLDNIEAAVFPGKTRQILGLSALSKAAPFIFSIDPPQLLLSNCIQADAT